MNAAEVVVGELERNRRFQVLSPGMREERIIDDDGNDIVIRFSGEV